MKFELRIVKFMLLLKLLSANDKETPIFIIFLLKHVGQEYLMTDADSNDPASLDDIISSIFNILLTIIIQF